MAKVLFIIANNWFQDNEFWIPYKTLTAQGHKCEIASGKWWYRIWVYWKEINETKAINEIVPQNYDLIIFIWWWWAEKQYKDNELYYSIAKKWKAIAAICIAPTILSYTWIFDWKEVTWRDDWTKTQINQIEKNGWIYKYEDVVQDWKIITANWPDAATKFAWKIIDYLKD